jgi:hypothetical protein
MGAPQRALNRPRPRNTFFSHDLFQTGRLRLSAKIHSEDRSQPPCQHPLFEDEDDDEDDYDQQRRFLDSRF